jgi:hypothetical protein
VLGPQPAVPQTKSHAIIIEAREEAGCHNPGKKREKKIKIPPGPTCQPLTLLSLFSSARRVHASPPPVNLGFRAMCRPSSRAVPTPPSSHRLKSQPRPRSPPTLTLARSPFSINAAAPELRPPPRFGRSGEPRLNPSRGEHLLPSLIRLRP